MKQIEIDLYAIKMQLGNIIKNMSDASARFRGQPDAISKYKKANELEDIQLNIAKIYQRIDKIYKG
jgi:hypothetical protein